LNDSSGLKDQTLSSEEGKSLFTFLRKKAIRLTDTTYSFGRFIGGYEHGKRREEEKEKIRRSEET
jgi:hypothetical protein